MTYQDEKRKLEARKCKTCDGIGKCDDADFGDIWFREWDCADCNGTGLGVVATSRLSSRGDGCSDA